jgi:CENP-B N-terminal DNA-binding domain
MARKKSTLGSTLTALQKAEAQVQQLRKKAASERAQQLEGLHVRFGFASRTELIEALVALDGTRRRGGSPKATTGSETPVAGRTSTRARLTPEMKAEIVEAIKAGESGVSVAERFSISGQTVQNIKKAAGLVRSRKKGKQK